MNEEQLKEMLERIFANGLKTAADQIDHVGRVVIVSSASGRRGGGLSVMWLHETGQHISTLAFISSSWSPTQGKISVTVDANGSQPQMHNKIGEQLQKWDFKVFDEWKIQWTFLKTPAEIFEMFKNDLDLTVELF